MAIKRRDLLKVLSLGTVIPGSMLKSFASAASADFLVADSNHYEQTNDINKLYDKAVVIDGLLIPRGWDEASFNALEKSGYTGFNASLPSRNLEIALKAMTDWKQRIEKNNDRLLHALTAEDFVRAKKENKTGVMFGFQNATMIENSVDNLDVLYEAGTRWIQLTYNQRNLIGDGCTERTNVGLSDFGIEVVNRMNELGIIVDLSHCGAKTTMEGIQFSKVGATINHSMCEALYPKHPRAKTDEQIRAMAKKGGVMGIICLGYMIGPDPGGETTLETYIDHVDHAVKIAGIDHVGLAADYPIQGLEANGATMENWYVPRLTRFKPSYQVRWPPWIPELETTDRYKYVAHALDKRGYRGDEIEKILGGNWLRYFRETLK